MSDNNDLALTRRSLLGSAAVTASLAAVPGAAMAQAAQDGSTAAEPSVLMPVAPPGAAASAQTLGPPAPQTAAEAFVDRLMAWQVDTIFGVTGDLINGLVDALRKRQDRIRFIHVRHEEAASMAAVGYSKMTGKLGVCFGTGGPGAAHMLNGLLDAHMDGASILAVTGMVYHDLVGTHWLQGNNAELWAAPVTVYNERVMGPAHVQTVLDHACRAALSQRGAAHLAFPIDIQGMPMNTARVSNENVPNHTNAIYSPPIRQPHADDLRRAAEVLRGKRRIAILAGAGAKGATAELTAVAEKLGAPIARALLGKEVIGDDSPYASGPIGHVGSSATEMAMNECDALLIVGSTMPFLSHYPKPGQAATVQIDDRPERIGLRTPVQVGLAGDVKATLAALLPMLSRNGDRAFLGKVQGAYKNWMKLMERQGTRPDTPMKPQVPAWQLGPLLAPDAIVTGDAGTVTYWVARHVRFSGGRQKFSFSGTNCSMASGLPYAIGAQAAFPTRQVVVFTGDGSATMMLGEFLTCVQNKLPIKMVVIQNNDLGLETWEQILYLGNPPFGNALAPIDFVKFAEACGGRGIRITDPAQCQAQLREALATDGPVLIECVVDPFEPVLEAPLTPLHAENMAKALARGTDQRERVAQTALRSLQDEQALTPDNIPPTTRDLIGKLSSGSY